MSLSQSFDASRAGSPSLPADVISDEGEVIWNVRGRGRIALVVPADCGSAIVTQQQYLSEIAPVRRSYDIVHCSVTKNSSGGRMCCYRRPEFILEEIRNGLISPWEELLLPMAPAKKFFDIEKQFEAVVRDSDVEEYVDTLVAHLMALCSWPSRQYYTVMRCQYPDDPCKLSLHVVVNDPTHFSNPKKQLDHMEQAGVDFETYGIDKNVYSVSTKRLRAIGACKWTEAGLSPPFYLIGKINSDFSMEDLNRCLVQRILPDSQCIDTRQDHLNHIQRLREIAQRAGPARPPPGRREAVPEVASVISTLRDISRRLNRDFDLLRNDAYRYASSKEGRLIRDEFFLPGRYYQSDDEILITVDPQCHVYSVRCPTNPNFRAIDFGYNEESHHYLRQEAYLKFLIAHKFSRVDFPIYDIFAPGIQQLTMLSTVGRFGYDIFSFFHELRETVKLARRERRVSIPCRGCDWCTSDSAMANDVIPSFVCSFSISNQLLDVNFFNFLRDRQASLLSTESSQLLLGYIELFVGFCVPAETWVVRTLDGIQGINASNLKEQYFGPLQYFVEKVSGRGDDRTYTWVAKPFWKYALEQQNRIKFERVASGKFVVGPDFPLNFARPLDVDVNYCLRRWNELKTRDPVTAAQLIGIWRTYGKLACFNEKTDKAPLNDVEAQSLHKDQVFDQLTRWVCEVTFKFGVRTSVMPVFVSQGGGQGKSTLGNIVCCAVGSKNFTTADPKTALGRFNDAYNGFCFFDEIHVNHEISEMLKSAITSPTVRLEAKFRKPVQTTNCRNFFATCNKTTRLDFINASKERRCLVLIFPELQAISDDGIISYTCQVCAKEPDQFGLSVCAHDILNHSELMEQIYTKILRHTDQGDVKGEFFDEFIGMLYTLYSYNTRMNIWTGSLQQSLILTSGTRELQLQSDTRAARWLDSCLETGFHWSPVIAPGRFGVRVCHRSDDVQRLGNTESAPVWELKVTRDALYSHFKDWCTANGETVQRQNEFLSDLQYLSQQRRGRPLETKVEKGCSLEWVKPHNTDKGQWIRQTDADQDVVVIYMGAWTRADDVDPNAQQGQTPRDMYYRFMNEPINGSREAREEAEQRRKELRARSIIQWSRGNVVGQTVVRPVLNRSNSGLPPTQMEEPINAPPRVLFNESTRGFAARINEEHPIEDRTRPVNVFEALGMLNDEDARQPLFLPEGVRRARDEDVDEEAQDAIAAIEDLRSPAKRSRFVDDAAEENDEIEEDGDAEPGGFHVSLSMSD